MRALTKLLTGAAAIAGTVCLATAASAHPTPAAEGSVLKAVDGHQSRLEQLASKIWRLAEVGYQEVQSSALLRKELQRAGFKVEVGVGGMPTAFIATSGKPGGPVIGILAEYDALPGVSHAALSMREAVHGQIAAHACGHNLMGAGAVVAAIVIADWLKATGRPGQVRLFGSPAEEGGGGKIYLARAGAFEDVDAVLAWHPGSQNDAGARRTIAVIGAKFRFRGVAAHAAGTPDQGRSALDGVEAMDAMVNQLREHMPQSARVHNVITAGGEAPNVVPAFAESYYMVRHPNADALRDLFDRVVKTAEGAALGTGTTVDYEIISGEMAFQPNRTLATLLDANLRRVGRPAFTADEARFAVEMLASLPGHTLTPGQETKIKEFRFGEISPGSTDTGDVSWQVPMAGVITASWVPGTPPHSWQAAAASNHSVGFTGANVGAKTLALTAAELFERPELLTEARKELEEMRGPGWAYKPLVGERTPPLDYRKAPDRAK